MTTEVKYEIHAEASGHIAAAPAEVWTAISDLSRRPNLKSCEFLAGTWPEEAAQARVLMDRGGFEMDRMETVIRCVNQVQLLVKVEASQWGSTAWLDHRIERESDGCRLAIGVIAIAIFPDGAGPASRDEYAALSRRGLQEAVATYRHRLEVAAG
jgi:hypothetical protein